METKQAVEIFTDDHKQIRFRIRNAKGDVIAHSGGYSKDKDCVEGLRELSDVMMAYRQSQIKIDHIPGEEKSIKR
jgi:uncharacterized protein YegP (UPF0339 family)